MGKLEDEIERQKRLHEIIGDQHADDSSSSDESSSDEETEQDMSIADNIFPLLETYGYTKAQVTKLCRDHRHNKDAINDHVARIFEGASIEVEAAAPAADDCWNQVLSKADKKRIAEEKAEAERKALKEKARLE